MNHYITATNARKTFYDAMKRTKKPGAYLIITHEGLPSHVLMSFEEFEAWEETMAIKADPELDRDVRAGIKEMKSGKKMKDTVDLDTVKKMLKI